MKPDSSASLLWWLIVRFRRPLAAIVVVFFIALGARLVLEAILNPWSQSFGLWPTLAGTWHGQVTAADGSTRLIYFDISGSLGRGRSSIDGKARLCNASGAVEDLRLYGRPDNWSGSRFHFSFTPLGEPRIGMQLGELRGEWSGDRLEAAGELYSNSPTQSATAERGGGVTLSHPNVPIRYSLQRGTEEDFLSACASQRIK